MVKGRVNLDLVRRKRVVKVLKMRQAMMMRKREKEVAMTMKIQKMKIK